jgi:hypothetical protein
MATRNSPHSGPYRELEREVEVERQQLALRVGERTLATVLLALCHPVQEIVDVERQNKGGAPALPIRRYVLGRLVELHNRFCRLYETWPRERYLDLAEQVLSALGQRTDGLEKAVGRFIGEL